MEVRFPDGVWHRGRLVERVEGTEPPRWKVQFDNGLVRDDIRIGDPEAPMRFDAGAYGSRVEVRFDGEWYRGRLVELVRGSDVWGVAFEDGDWAEDVRVNSPDVRYLFAEGGAGLVKKRGRGEGAGDGGSEGSRKRVGAEGQGTGGSGGRRDGGHEQLPRNLIQQQGETQTSAHQEPHFCETCGKAFSQAVGLAVHLRMHSEKPHVCETCGTAFWQAVGLTSHMRSHAGEKSYVCETCGKAFSQAGQLNSHVRTHIRPHVCETCGKAFSQADQLNSHVRKHTVYVCETCGYTCAARGRLEEHMRTHTGERPFVCGTCGWTFAHRGSLDTHMRRHTGCVSRGS